MELTEPKHNVYEDKIEIGGQFERALTLVISEISQTVLPRLITLDCQPKGKIRLKISHRRLFECHVSNRVISGRSEPSGDIQSLAKEFVDTLREFFEGSQTLRFLAPEPIEERGDPSMSCSAQLLLDAVGIEVPIGVHETPVSFYAEQLKKVALAWRLSSTLHDSTVLHGEKEDQELLEAVSHALVVDGRFQASDTFAQARESSFVFPLKNGKVICILHTPDAYLTALVDEADMISFGAFDQPEL